MPFIVCINAQAPDFTLPGVLKDRVSQFTLSHYRGRWVVLFFYPADFSFICPTEVKGFNDTHKDFANVGAEILGISTDSVEMHRDWGKELGGIDYPLLSDGDKKVSRLYNSLNEEEGVAVRATFIIDPQGVLKYINMVHKNVGRSVEETHRVFEALRTERMCPADWQPGEETFDLSHRY